MTISVKDGGTWKDAVPYVKDGGAWKAVQAGYVKDAGTWKQFLSGVTFSLNDYSISGSGTAPTDNVVGYRLGSDGNQYTGQGNPSLSLTNQGPYISPTSEAANYEVRATIVSGTTDTGDTTGTWLPLTTNRSWNVIFTGNNGSKACVLTIELRRASDGVVVDTATVTLTAAVSP